MNRQNMSPEDVLEIMLKKDKFTKWLGLQIDEHRKGYCKLHFKVTEDMINGFDIVHGGVLFSASDSALAFACNSHGRVSVALDVSISFTAQVKEGEILNVEAKEIHVGNKIGVYDIRTINEKEELVCFFKGTVYRTAKEVR
ncbi:MAG TPA: hotdog fold thioesterase [Puia sp.]|nr:hotdog fold thioesterase [Puia sp.]